MALSKSPEEYVPPQKRPKKPTSTTEPEEVPAEDGEREGEGEAEAEGETADSALEGSGAGEE